MTFTEWDAANRDALWNGGKTPLREQYMAVWNAALDAAIETAQNGGQVYRLATLKTESPSESSGQ
jgi:hypothetical protein